MQSRERHAADLLRGAILADYRGEIVRSAALILITANGEQKFGVAVTVRPAAWIRYLRSKGSRQISQAVTYAMIGINHHGDFLEQLAEDPKTRAILAQMPVVLVPDRTSEEEIFAATMTAVGALPSAATSTITIIAR